MWFAWLSNQIHASLFWSLIGFAGIAWNAGAYDVFPSGWPVMLAWDHVVEIQIPSIKFFPAILAGIFVALKNVMTSEFNFFSRHAIVDH